MANEGDLVRGEARMASMPDFHPRGPGLCPTAVRKTRVAEGTTGPLGAAEQGTGGTSAHDLGEGPDFRPGRTKPSRVNTIQQAAPFLSKEIARGDGITGSRNPKCLVCGP